jgi:hypothetical protein
MQHVTGNSLSIRPDQGINITVVGSSCLILNDTNKAAVVFLDPLDKSAILKALKDTLLCTDEVVRVGALEIRYEGNPYIKGILISVEGVSIFVERARITSLYYRLNQ